MKSLLMGSGSSRDRRFKPNGVAEWDELVTLDYNADHNPDVVHDLNVHPLPFEDNTFDEIHAYEVLEHLASLGDYRFFFSEFSEYWRILKPGGFFCATVPDVNSPWLFGDPSHTRVIVPESLTFLSQAEYEKQVGKTAMSDFRFIYKADFEAMGCQVADSTLAFVLKAIKA
jgi:SAM-dependent methyltransferase